MTPSSTRARALQAAIELLGSAGLRALTHARVDERAGLPPGSTSNHFRTRAALLGGAVDELAARDVAALTDAPQPRDAAELVAALAASIETATGPERTATAARMVLFLEASHDLALRERASAGREALRAWAVPVLARLGARDPELAFATVAAVCEGLLFHAIARYDPTDPRPALEATVRGVLGWSPAGSRST